MPAKVKQQTSSSPAKLMLDEEAFQQLLEAAYVMQQQNDAAPADVSEHDPARTLSQIVETQELLRSEKFDLQAATVLIAERMQRMTSALGVAIAVARDAHLEFCARAGSGVTALGSRVPIDSSPSAGQTLPEEGLRSLVVFPVHHEGKVAGILEVRFAGEPPYDEHLIHTCQLMKGLIAEAIARSADLEWKHALAAERATVIEALERMRPHLDRLMVEPATAPSSTEPAAAQKAAEIESSGSTSIEPAIIEPAVIEPAIGPEPKINSDVESHPEAAPEAALQHEQDGPDEKEARCRVCGYEYGEDELFCGNCGTARATRDSSSDLQGKWASMWRMQQAAERRQKENAEENVSPVSAQPQPLSADREQETEVANTEAAEEDAQTTALARQESTKGLSPWTSATHTRKWLESLQAAGTGKIWLGKQRANIYLGLALVILLGVLSGWGTRRVQNGMADVRQKNSPAQLTAFERVLVSLGLAEAPTPLVYKGNPNTQVWVDLHTALYYCPGSELYGKTAGGKFTSQRDAQQDQFEPAAQKSCD